jgi:coenzyme F420-reducing hydrogenase alpha subunit
VPPTSQNQGSMEADLLHVAPEVMSLGDDEATLRCERVIRDYDPCISCSVHFLRLSRESELSSPRQSNGQAISAAE